MAIDEDKLLATSFLFSTRVLNGCIVKLTIILVLVFRPSIQNNGGDNSRTIPSTRRQRGGCVVTCGGMLGCSKSPGNFHTDSDLPYHQRSLSRCSLDLVIMAILIPVAPLRSAPNIRFAETSSTDIP